MPLKLNTTGRAMTLTWTSPDDNMEATWKVRPTDSEESIISTLERALIFIKNQRAEIAAQIAEAEADLQMDGASADLSPASGPAAPADAPRIPMVNPNTLGGAPAGGAPVETFGWGSMPTQSVPEHLSGAWEMIPPGEA